MPLRSIGLSLLGSCLAAAAAAQFAVPPSLPGGAYEPGLSTPAAVLGFPPGERPARYDEVVRYLTYLAGNSPRVRLVEMGRTYEGRMQVLLLIGSEDRVRQPETVRAANASLADPRKTGEAETHRLLESSPLVVWAGYGIHGDELSSVDAALQVAYQLAAGTDPGTRELLQELFVVIDPMQNPDGRERFLAQMQQWGGVIPNPDAQSIHHAGMWPYGRGNHYLFDVNRDWILVTQVETQNRLRQISRWNPQLVIDSHEMGAYDTYLFSPPREPLNPNVPKEMHRWWELFAADQAKAFDHFGWSYYTHEWNDEWYPGYGASWPLYNDALGILYEQAGVEGSLVKRPDGTTLTYRETVHHHVVSTLANLTTAAKNRKGLLTDFYERKKRGVTAGAGQAMAYYLAPGANPGRAARLVANLLAQGIEVRRLQRPTRVSGLRDTWGGRPATRTLSAGTYAIPIDQPKGRLANAVLDFDPHMKTSVLQEERKSLEKNGDSKLYDVTSWSLPIAYGVEAYATDERIQGATELVSGADSVSGGIIDPRAGFGYLVDYADDHAPEALCRFFEDGLTVRTAREPFELGGRKYDRGTLLLRKNENPQDLDVILARIARTTGVTAYGTNTARSTSGVDLGGNDMLLLKMPRVAVVGGPEIGTTGLGAVWHMLDQRYRMRISMLQVGQLAGSDLGKYTVLLFPSGEPQGISRVLGKAGGAKLRGWIEGGGTLIALGGSAAFVADTSSGLSSVRLRQQALKELDLYARALVQEARASEPAIDSAGVWNGTIQVRDTMKAGTVNEKELLWQDERGRLFMPRGTFLTVDLDAEHWMTYGMGTRVAALMFGSTALLSRNPVRTPARFAPAAQLRVSGLLWPEARDRWAQTAFATAESKGNGQVLLFAGDPAYRGAHEATQRLLINSILLGPGCGTRHTVQW
jgi:hypothetical protein